jgi:RNA polymerase sigma-70 factor, ECF subfamily
VPAESNTQLLERELISQVLAGERDHFHELLRPYERAMYIAAFSILRNQTDAEEAVQEAVLNAMTHLGQL